MSTIVTRVGKGSPLTWTEVDSNFTNLNTDKLQSGNTASSLTITSATINGGSINGTTVGASTASSGAFTTLSATGVTTVQAGTVSLPAITTTGDTNTGIFFPAADTIAFTEGGVESGRFTSAGALQLNANLTFTGTGNRITGDFSNATQNSRVLFQTSTTNGNTNIAAIPNGTATTASLVAYNSSTDPDNSARFRMTISGASSVIASDISGTGTYVPIIFQTGGSERLRIDTSGNVGIGTSSPNAKLQVNGIAAINGGAAATDFALNLTGSTGVTGGVIAFTSGATISTALYSDSGGGIGFIGTRTNHPLGFLTNATERMRIDSSGNVGIGTASSPEKLTVIGNVRGEIVYGNRASAAAVTAGGLGVGIDGTVQAQIVSPSSSAMAIYTGGTERMRIDSSGNVGIGTTGPSGFGKFAVVGVSGTPILSYYDGTITGTAGYTSGGVAYSGTRSNHPIGFLTNDTERMRIDSSGNVLVGVTSPGSYAAGSAIGTTGYISRSGTGGSFSNNRFNIFWNGSAARLWIDTVDQGSIAISSDYRIKKDIQSQTLTAIDRINEIRPVTYTYADNEVLNWKADGVAREGFIAHELAEIIPSAVDGEKDAENQIQSLKLDALCSVMVKAIQEQQTIINDLKARIETLETK